LRVYQLAFDFQQKIIEMLGAMMAELGWFCMEAK